ncbi:putative exported protein [Halobacteriovorax marinus SJ]|uniref:Exported protein n=1 Tax=Halobacteriovorax marinus (strain ATCC BAA-682 / DSM 15412 / SJ) TaxID=862908 RepID=E1X590_HALMS|nr:hypothetical protein [Halobacteriovorax marinus]CBW25562.1 putative exported protein [Halobacteriovorax marinus SJ]
MKYIILTILFLASSCSSYTLKNYERRNERTYEDGNGVIQYFLADLPNWANFSSAGSCHRNFPVRYLNIKNLRDSFALSYEEAIQFQLMFNEYSKEKKEMAKASYIPFKDEEKIFYTVLDKIKAGIRNFQKPKYNVVNLIWIDDALSNKKSLQKLKKVTKSEKFGTGHPVFISLCLNRVELKDYLAKVGIRVPGAKFLSYELLNPFDHQNNLVAVPIIDLNRVFNKNQKIQLFLPKDRPFEFKGKVKLVDF